MPVGQFVIVGIHGLAKKPDRKTLTKWWKAAICEGLNHNIAKYKRMPISPSALNFSMVYWNDSMGRNRILEVDQLRQDRSHYQKAYKGHIEAYRPGFSKKLFHQAQIKLRDVAGDITSVIMKFTRGEVSQEVMQKGLKDLDRYYKDAKLRGKLQDLLATELEQHSDKRIMLISHSMGTIIAHDTLKELATQKNEIMKTTNTAPPPPNPDSNRLEVNHFITMGSPLGLPFITERIRQKKKITNVPANIKKWTNFSDMYDPVCADPNLADDYRKSSIGVKIVDQLVNNDWPNDKLSHKSYGYLRTPEVSKAIAAFIR